MSGSGEIDTSHASVARVYDALLGGKDNYEVDREVVAYVGQIAPETRPLARATRAWLVRAVRWLASDAGIDQFLDCGSGLPTMENVHQVAQRANPEARVVYVDSDPTVAAYGRALLEENELTRFVDADLTQPEELLTHPVVTEHLDLGRPYALIQSGTIHHLADSHDPYGIMQRYIAALPSGSYVGLTHMYDPGDGSEASQLAREVGRRFRESNMGSPEDSAAETNAGQTQFRSYQEILSYFDGLELVAPGLVRVREWAPDEPPPPPQGMDFCFLGGVGRKP